MSCFNGGLSLHDHCVAIIRSKKTGKQMAAETILLRS